MEEAEEGRKQMQAMKDTTMRSKEVQEKLQAANSKLQFEMAESNRVAAEREKEVIKLKGLLEEKERGSNEDETVSALKEELGKKEEEVVDMRQLLEEASVEFLEKEEEVKKLEGEVALREKLVTNLQLSLTDLQSQLEESHLMLGGANDRLEEKEARLEEIETDLEAGHSKLGELRRRIGELEGESRVTGEKMVALEALNLELKQLVSNEEKKVSVEEVKKCLLFCCN